MNEIETSYDQAMLLRPSDFKIFNDVANVISSSIIQADPSPALEYGRNLRREGQLKGLALAKLLSMLKGNWDKFKYTGIEEAIEDIVYVEMGIKPQTTRKYVALWDELFENPDIPDPVKEKLYGKSIRSLLLLTATAKDGDEVDWFEIAGAENDAEIREIIRKARGSQTSSETSILLMMDRDGTLYAKKGTSQDKTVFGKLDLTKMLDPIAEKAISRLIRQGGILWQ